MQRFRIAALLAVALAVTPACFDGSRLDPYECDNDGDCASAPSCGAASPCACEDGICLPPPAPGTDSGPGTDMNVPGSDMNVPGSDMNVPGSDMNVPGTDMNVPGTDSSVACMLPTDCVDPLAPVCPAGTCEPCTADPTACPVLFPTLPICRSDGRCVECLNNGDCPGGGNNCLPDGTCSG